MSGKRASPEGGFDDPTSTSRRRTDSRDRSPSGAPEAAQNNSASPNAGRTGSAGRRSGSPGETQDGPTLNAAGYPTTGGTVLTRPSVSPSDLGPSQVEGRNSASPTSVHTPGSGLSPRQTSGSPGQTQDGSAVNAAGYPTTGGKDIASMLVMASQQPTDDAEARLYRWRDRILNQANHSILEQMTTIVPQHLAVAFDTGMPELVALFGGRSGSNSANSPPSRSSSGGSRPADAASRSASPALPPRADGRPRTARKAPPPAAAVTGSSPVEDASESQSSGDASRSPSPALPPRADGRPRTARKEPPSTTAVIELSSEEDASGSQFSDDAPESQSSGDASRSPSPALPPRADGRPRTARKEPPSATAVAELSSGEDAIAASSDEDMSRSPLPSIYPRADELPRMARREQLPASAVTGPSQRPDGRPRFGGKGPASGTAVTGPVRKTGGKGPASGTAAKGAARKPAARRTTGDKTGPEPVCCVPRTSKNKSHARGRWTDCSIPGCPNKAHTGKGCADIWARPENTKSKPGSVGGSSRPRVWICPACLAKQ